MHALWAFGAALLQASLPPPPAAPATADTTRLAIVATTDVHGRVRAWDYVRDAEEAGGLARAATMIDTLRARYPDRLVLLDAGDLLQGNPFAHFFATQDERRPHPIIDALNALRYDAATPGNHEFDYGLDFFVRAARDAAFRYVSANITKGVSDSSLLESEVVIMRGGVRVAITGFTTPGVMLWDRTLVAGKIRVHRIEESAPAALRRLAGTGADLKIVAIHSGLAGTGGSEMSSYDTTGIGTENAGAALATLEPRPDLVVVGHTHREISDTVINGVHFMQPGNWARSLSVAYVTLVRDALGGPGGPRGRLRIVDIRAALIPLVTTAEQPRLVRRLADAHERVRVWAALPLGVAAAGFEGRTGRAQDTPLLDFINEVQRRHTGADLSAAALFVVGPGLPEGEVRLRDVQGIYPYENTLRAVRVSGQQLKAFLEHASRYYNVFAPGTPVVNQAVPGYNFDAVAGPGFRYTIDLSQPVGRRVGMSWQGRPVQPSDSFTLALNSYRQEGGGGFAMLKDSRVVYDRGESVRDLLVEAIRRGQTIRPAQYFSASWGLLPPEAREAALRHFGPAGAR